VLVELEVRFSNLVAVAVEQFSTTRPSPQLPALQFQSLLGRVLPMCITCRPVALAVVQQLSPMSQLKVAVEAVLETNIRLPNGLAVARDLPVAQTVMAAQ
jgi:hypothetical protein